METNIVVTSVVVGYLLLMLYIGWYSSKRINTNADFMVAGRRIGPFLMAGTLAATEIGGSSTLGVVQNGMEGYGLSAAWYVLANGIAFAVLSFMAPYFRATMVKTVPEYFRRRYGKACGLITSLIMIVPFLGLTAGQFIASAVMFSTMLGLDYATSLLIVAVVVTAYSVMGGLWSVAITDFVQIFLIVIGMMIAVPYSLDYAGGWEAVKANIPPGTLDMFSGYDFFGVISLIVMYMTTLAVGQEVVSRFYAARDEKAARGGAWLAACINFTYAFVPAVLGIIVLALINMGKFSSTEFAAVGARYALPVLAMHTMPAIICSLLFAGIIAATMSSADSDLLGAGSIFANDIYKQFLHPKASNKEVMRVAQISMVIVSLIGVLVALNNTQSLIAIVTFCFTLRAAGLFFPYILGHFWKKASAAGTIASLIMGTIVVVYLEYVSQGYLFGIHFSQAIVPGLVAAFVGFMVFSWLMPAKVATLELTPEED